MVNLARRDADPASVLGFLHELSNGTHAYSSDSDGFMLVALVVALFVVIGLATLAALVYVGYEDVKRSYILQTVTLVDDRTRAFWTNFRPALSVLPRDPFLA